MSAFLAIRDSTGRPVPAQLVDGLRHRLSWRGPDGSDAWHEGPVGLIQAQFRTVAEDERIPGPVELRGVRIVGDVRLDARGLLVDRLASAGFPVGPETSDLSLVLHAHFAYGQGCLEHLAGDFAFVIWDPRHRHLFAARDQLGLVPLYWSLSGRIALVGNSLHGLLAHPQVDDGFDEEMIADHLAVGIRLSADRTFYRGIRRLPAGHCLKAGDGGIEIGRYWSMRERLVQAPRRPPREYVEECRALITQSVRDRLRGAAAATHLSGGMDAASMAVSLARITEAGSPTLRAYTHVVSELFPDPEGPLAALVARRAGIGWEAVPIEPIIADDEHVAALVGPPEPVLPPPLSFRGAIERRAATRARVLFNGYGGDPLFAGGPIGASVARGWMHTGQEWRDIVWCAGMDPGLVRLWLHRSMRASPGKRTLVADSLLNREFAAEFGIQRRRADRMSQPPGDAIESMAGHPVWMARMTEADPDFTGLALKQRFPFFDLRLIEFAAALPVRPWRTKKTVLRLAMRDLLPPEIRLRPKTSGGDEVLGAYLRSHGPRPWMYELLETANGGIYFDKAAAIRCIENSHAHDKVAMRRLSFVFSAANWLRNRPRDKV